MKIGVAQPLAAMRSSAGVGITPPNVDGAAKPTLSGAFHLAFSASEVFLGVAVSDWPLPYAVLTYRSPSFVIFVVQPVFQVITAEFPSSFQVPVIPSPRVAFSAPPLDSMISNGCPTVSFTFHTPSNALSARAPKLVTPKKQAAIAAFLIFVLLATSMLVTENGVLNLTVPLRILSFFPPKLCSLPRRPGNVQTLIPGISYSPHRFRDGIRLLLGRPLASGFFFGFCSAPLVIPAHIPQCGSAIPRAAHLTREPFQRVGA